jgi:tripartite-type tricarboxylate transporter receptor subunit TctC
MAIARRAALGLLAAPAILRAQAQWPDRPVRLVVPFGPGGAIDTLSRLCANAFAAHAGGQNLVVDNRVGGGGTIGAAQVAQARPDGYTLLMADMGPNLVARALAPNTAYDPLTAFTPIVQAVNLPNVLIAKPALGVRTTAELIAKARERRDGLSYASASVGNHSHLYMELLMRQADISMVHAPYRSGAETVASVARGETDCSLITVSSAIGLIRGGQVLALATGTASGTSLLPDVPPVGATLPGFDTSVWHGVMGPAGMATDLVSRINAVFNAVLAEPAVRQAVANTQGGVTVGGPPERFSEFLRREAEVWLPLIRERGIRAEG